MSERHHVAIPHTLLRAHLRDLPDAGLGRDRFHEAAFEGADDELCVGRRIDGGKPSCRKDGEGIRLFGVWLNASTLVDALAVRGFSDRDREDEKIGWSLRFMSGADDVPLDAEARPAKIETGGKTLRFTPDDRGGYTVRHTLDWMSRKKLRFPVTGCDGNEGAGIQAAIDGGLTCETSVFEGVVVDRRSAVKDVALVLPLAVVLWRLLQILQDAALQVIDLFEALLQHEG